MSFKILYAKSVQKDIKNLDNKTKEKIKKAKIGHRKDIYD